QPTPLVKEDGTYNAVIGDNGELVVSAVGGPTRVTAVATLRTDDRVQESFDLTRDAALDLWKGVLDFETPGIYDVVLNGEDGAGRTAMKPFNSMVVEEAGKGIEGVTGEPLPGAVVTLYVQDAFGQWASWPGAAYHQMNPQTTTETGRYRFLVPPGTYYMEVNKEGYQTTVSQIIELENGGPISGDVRVPQRSFPWPSWLLFANAVEITTDAITQQAAGLPFTGVVGDEITLSLPLATGEVIDLSQMRGRPVLLTLWNTWDSQSQEQLAVLDRVAEQQGANATILPLVLQESESAVATYLTRGEYDVESLVDETGLETVGTLPVFTVPQHVFIGSDGRVEEIVFGLQDEQLLTTTLNSLR
ncbi:MAG: carboxypeptidase regulatory-like domain-containing protein, partial [Candidatus Andersenbacteria bacterium]|nr:carboxypeptidase regulatory-like domain-containing protein [Candidatus Andersenbacteria bacterium]